MLTRALQCATLHYCLDYGTADIYDISTDVSMHSHTEYAYQCCCLSFMALNQLLLHHEKSMLKERSHCFCTGPVPADLCEHRDGGKNLMLNALLLNSNSLSGTLPSRCLNLFIVNAAVSVGACAEYPDVAARCAAAAVTLIMLMKIFSTGIRGVLGVLDRLLLH